MDTLQVLGSAMGLGLLAGIRLYATVFALGLAIRLGFFHLNSTFSNLDVLAQTPVLTASGLACTIEFFADKVPWLDSLWDSVHTFIRPIGAAFLGATALGNFDPTTKLLLSLLCGGIAFTGHTSKAATRLVANHSPEPFSNVALSVTEDLLVPAGLWVVFQHPVVAAGIVTIFLALFAWLSPGIFRLLHVSWTALRSLFAKWTGQHPQPVDFQLPDLPAGNVRRAFEEVPFQPLPPAYARKLDNAVKTGVHCVARSSIRGFKNSSGYLCVTSSEIVFVAQRMFRLRTYRAPLADLRDASLRRGMFLDPLVLMTSDQQLGFDVFKGARASTFAGKLTPVNP